MIAIALLVFLQASAGLPSGPGHEAQTGQPEGAPSHVAELDEGASDQPKVVCTMEPITGTRAKKQKVCKTPGYEKGSERYRDMLGAIQRASNVQPGEPPAQGVRPGGPGY